MHVPVCTAILATSIALDSPPPPADPPALGAGIGGVVGLRISFSDSVDNL